MGIFSKLFGARTKAPPNVESVEYNGYSIEPRPLAQGGHYITAGLIRKNVADSPKEQQFIRADTHVSFDDACAHAIRKAQQIIDEQGDRLFDR